MFLHWLESVGNNHYMTGNKRSGARVAAGVAFSPGKMVVATLAAPREKYWGELLELSAAGLSMRAISLDSFADFASQVRAGDRVDAAVLFFPMHRVERIEVDARNGEVESLAERFAAKSGKAAKAAFGGGAAR